MATEIIKNGKNDDLEMLCIDEEMTTNQQNNITKLATVTTTFAAQLHQLVEKIKKPQETVELFVINNHGSQELHSKFIRSDGPSLQPLVASSKMQVLPRIQSVTSLAPKVVQQVPGMQPQSITYRVVPLINQNMNKTISKSTPSQSQTVQSVDYRFLLPQMPQQQQALLRQPTSQSIILPSAPVLVLPQKQPSANTNSQGQVSYQNVLIGANTPHTSTPNPRTTQNMVTTPPPEVILSPIESTENTGKFIELTYYGSKEGTPTYGQSRGNFTFKCMQCNQVISSNIVFMRHIKDHFEVERVKNSRLSKLISCEYCFKAFPSVEDLSVHKVRVHFNSGFKCKFCEYSFANKVALMTHLDKKHKPLQMPYVCKLCGFMTSVYQDIMQHFLKKHDRTKFLLCSLCLKVMADVRSFFKHCQMHYQSTNLSKGHCRMCKLIFLNSQDFREHTSKEHIIHKLSNKTAATSSPTKQTVKRHLPQIPIHIPAKRQKTVQSSPASANSTALSFAKCLPEFSGPLRCCECGARANIQNHFRRYVLKCRKCRYHTYCQRSFSSHSNIFHNSERPPPVLHPVSKTYNHTKNIATLKCQRCLFTTQSASFMAWHVVICPKGSSIVESFCYRKNTATLSEPKKIVTNEDPIVIDDSDDEEDKVKANNPTTSNTAVNGLH